MWWAKFRSWKIKTDFVIFRDFQMSKFRLRLLIKLQNSWIPSFPARLFIPNQLVLRGGIYSCGQSTTFYEQVVYKYIIANREKKLLHPLVFIWKQAGKPADLSNKLLECRGALLLFAQWCFQHHTIPTFSKSPKIFFVLFCALRLFGNRKLFSYI